jgi:hypothetical protein
MAYGDALKPGATLWVRTTPVTTAESPATSPWINTEGFSQVYVIGAAAGGTTAVTLEWGYDNSTADASITPTTVSPLALTVTLRDVLAPYMRMSWAQTVSNTTTSKIMLKARA